MYERWEVHEHLPDNFYLSKVCEEKGTLKLNLKELNQLQTKQFVIKFTNSLSYRITVESGRLKSLDDLNLRSFCKTTESEFISWFKDEGLGIYDGRLIVQYTIVNPDNIIDVISEYPPTAEWI